MLRNGSLCFDRFGKTQGLDAARDIQITFDNNLTITGC